MTQPSEGVRASDADRDVAASALADAVASGRLTLAEHEQRLDTVFTAVTQDQVAAVTADLPALPARRGALYRAVDAHRCMVVGGSAQRAGRFQIGRFCTVTAVFGHVDLDLRAAVPSQGEVTLTVWGVAARVNVTVPIHWRVTNQVLVLGSSQAMPDCDGHPHAPLLRLRGTCVGGAFLLTQG
ncbi:MAG TPA: DUF1707 domain-containing protein [Streptosporangiaceae bacterium]|nr:DUF1707 domain-containing protein [Streptosporangiaceae bacterium]